MQLKFIFARLGLSEKILMALNFLPPSLEILPEEIAFDTHFQLHTILPH